MNTVNTEMHTAVNAQPIVRHQELVDHPSARTRRGTIATRCGRFAAEREIAATVDDVTCARCLAAIERHETVNV